MSFRDCKVKLLPALVEALRQAEEKARAAGLIQGDDEDSHRLKHGAPQVSS